MLLFIILSATCITVIPALLLGIRMTFLHTIVEGQSMSPTLLDGDRVLVFRYWPKVWLRKGHMILLKQSKGDPPSKDFPPDRIFIKQVAGLPRETADVEVASIPLAIQSSRCYDSDGKRHWPIAPKHIFVLADAGGMYVDSRTWGQLPYRYVAGVVVMKLPRNEQIAQKYLESHNDYKQIVQKYLERGNGYDQRF